MKNLLTVITLSLTLIGCGGGGGSSESTTPVEPTTPNPVVEHCSEQTEYMSYNTNNGTQIEFGKNTCNTLVTYSQNRNGIFTGAVHINNDLMFTIFPYGVSRAVGVTIEYKTDSTYRDNYYIREGYKYMSLTTHKLNDQGDIIETSDRDVEYDPSNTDHQLLYSYGFNSTAYFNQTMFGEE